MSSMTIYCDGGVVGGNPSDLGGVWAFCDVADGRVFHGASGVIRPFEVGLPGVSNNLSELWAAIMALEYAARDEIPELVTLHTDSIITMRRVMDPVNAKMNGIPRAVHERLIAATQCLGIIQVVLVGGHPTQADLANGFKAKNRLPVSQWNVWCDDRCNAEKELRAAELRLSAQKVRVQTAETLLEFERKVLEISSEEASRANFVDGQAV